MTHQGAQFLPAFQVPHLERVIFRTRYSPSSVRGHGYGQHPMGMTLQGTQHLEGFQVPQPKRCIGIVERDSPSAIRGHGYRFDLVFVPLKGAELLERLQVPHLECGVRRVSPVSRSHTLSVVSVEPETARLPSRVMATAQTPPA